MEQRTLTPKQLILQLLSAAPQQRLSIQGLLRAGEILDISPNHMRVTCTRLKASGLIEVTRRGRYQLGPGARSLQREVAGWRELEARVGTWDGSWLAVHGAGLARGDRKELRRRRRLLRLLGFRELVTDLEIRPHNLIGGVAGIRSRLRRLGLDPGAPVFRITNLGEELAGKAPALWRARELNRCYLERREALNRLRADIGAMPFERAARAVFLAGNDAIRELVYDPLLPEPIVDTAARGALLQTTIAFDALGRRLWARVLGIEADPLAPAATGRARIEPQPARGISGEWYG